LTVEQRGVDIALWLEDPAGHPLYETDAPNGNKGVENVWLVAPGTGEYRLAIVPLKPAEKGSVVLAVRELRTARQEDRLRATAERALARAEMRRLAGDPEAAVGSYRESLPPFAILQDRERLAFAEWHFGQTLAGTGQLLEAVGALEGAASRFRDLNDDLGEARALNDLGDARRQLGELAPALEGHQRALTLYRQAGSNDGTATSLNDIGLVLRDSGDFEGALSNFEQALALWERLPGVKSSSKAATLENLGTVYSLLGHDQEALDVLERALSLLAGGKILRQRISTLVALGTAEYLAGFPERALGRFQEAIELSARSGNPILAAAVWDRRGTVLRALGRYGEAAKSYAQALALARPSGNRLAEGNALANLGWLDLETGAASKARERLKVALELVSRRGDIYGEAYTRMGLSRAERALGSLQEAQAQAEAAVRLFERMRATLRGPTSRGQFSATRFNAYEELVSLLMDLDRREPGRGHDLEALEVAERARARNLLEGLAGAGGPVEATRPDEPRRQALLGEILAMEERRQFLAIHDPCDPRIQRLDAELRGRWLELDRLAPPPTSSPLVPSLKAAEIQRLTDEQSLLVVYLLAEPASFAWTIDPDGIETHVLPGRARIERLARRVVAGLSEGPELAAQRTVEASMAELSRAVLAPLGSRLEGRKSIAVLADGALHLVSFAALPSPTPGGEIGREPLLVRHEIAMIPSATFLREQRRRLAGRVPAPKSIAVLADPLFSLDDERLSGSSGRRSAGEGRREPEAPYPGPLQRLPFTADEARAIVRLVPSGQALLAMGPAASRDLVTGGALRGYRILHFATHGILDPVLPERSGIVLSQFDNRGRRHIGFLSAPTVAGLDLPADLAVLSGCQTGLGREVRGEGLVGLPQAFFRAGTRRVVVSLWKVQDRGTAELMSRFYRYLLIENLSPASSLRAAQLSLYQEGSLRSPYFWAGFTLQGDWK
jgi:CHAT domain-containing protein/Tfp pilus assembly protein PilF